MTASEQAILSKASSLLAEALNLLEQQARATQQVVESANQVLAFIADSKGFVPHTEAERLLPFTARQLKVYRENGTFKHGVHYRDVRSSGSSTGTYQYTPAAINRLFNTEPEKRL